MNRRTLRGFAWAALAALGMGCLGHGGPARPGAQRLAASPDRAAVEPGAEDWRDMDLALHVLLGRLPDRMPQSENDTPAQIALGRKLYFDRVLSINRTQSCNDCHLLDHGRAGVDNQPTSAGARGEHGKRNAPTTLNAGFHAAQFWDGRAADLAEQAKGPVLNPVEMAMPNPEIVLARLKADSEHRRAFRQAFPNQADPVTYDNVGRAIAAFEHTLVSPGRFDRFLDGEESILTADEKKGMVLLMRLGCEDCHGGRAAGGQTFRKLGEHHPFPDRTDEGRFNVTQNEQDRQVFKVPSLRNVTLTAPYFHNGSVPTLAEAVELMGWLQLDRRLTPRQVDLLLCFLQTLADTSRTAGRAGGQPRDQKERD